MAGFSLICCVVNMGDGSKTLKIAKKHGVKDGIVSLGRGTANSRMLGLLGLNDIRKEIVKLIVENELVSKAIKGISEDMSFDKPHHGIAFSHSGLEIIDSASVGENNSNISEVKNNMYKSIHVVVDKGVAEDVIEVANKAGARGGTIVNARGSGTNEVKKFFSIEIEPEKEEVFIIAKNELKDRIVEAIRSHLSIEKPGNGIMFVLDVNEAYGLQ